MTYRAQVVVTLKPVVNDPEGLTILDGLHALGFDGVRDVRAGKYLVLTLEAADRASAGRLVEEMSRTLLANAVIEDFEIELAEVREPAGSRPS